jgi:amino acid transporter
MLLEQATTQFTEHGWSAIAAGAFIAFFAFLGFEDIVNVAEEVKNPTHNLPLAIILALSISTLLYFTISVVAIATVAPAELAGNPAPLALVYERAAGTSPLFIVLVSIAAIINGTLVMLIMASRILYGMSNQQWLPAQLSYINPTTRTPIYSTVLISLLILIFALWLPLSILAVTTSLFTLIVFFSINLSLLVIKRRDHQHGRHPEGIHSYPAWIPVAGLFSSSAFLSSQIYYWL